MGTRQLMFGAMYRLGFTPWDGHPVARGLRDLVEGNGFTPGTALDVGCGTGDNAIYLAQHGWQVTGVDFTSKALEEARDKAADRHTSVSFVHADVTRLSSADVGADFDLAVDNGCIHGMSDNDRAAYVREITAVTTPNARLLIVAFRPGMLFGVRGIEQADIERIFSPHWALVTAGDEPDYRPANGDHPTRHYLLQRRP